MIELVARVLEAPLRVGDSPAEPRDAIVVLGAKLARDGGITPIVGERVRAAAELFRQGGGPRIVVSGGVTAAAPRSEARAMADALIGEGIAAGAIVLEDASQTTRENALRCAELLAPGARVWLVTQPFHGRRAAYLFARAGLAPRVWHIADSVQYRDRQRAVVWLAREYASWAKLLVRG